MGILFSFDDLPHYKHLLKPIPLHSKNHMLSCRISSTGAYTLSLICWRFMLGRADHMKPYLIWAVFLSTYQIIQSQNSSLNHPFYKKSLCLSSFQHVFYFYHYIPQLENKLKYKNSVKRLFQNPFHL